jgi:transcriptional regulator with XRE-family HTH domain
MSVLPKRPRTPAQQSIGDRIRLARLAIRLSQSSLARALRIEASSVNQWESGRTSPNDKQVPIISSLLNVNESWLKSGEGGPEIAHLGRLALLLSPEEALALPNEPKHMPGRRAYLPHFPCSGATFAIAVFDRSNEPDFAFGDILFIDPLVDPEPGDMVLIAILKKTEWKPIFGQLSYPRRLPRERPPNLSAEDFAQLMDHYHRSKSSVEHLTVRLQQAEELLGSKSALDLPQWRLPRLRESRRDLDQLLDSIEQPLAPLMGGTGWSRPVIRPTNQDWPEQIMRMETTRIVGALSSSSRPRLNPTGPAPLV